jgi:hypothetical protein
MKCRTGFVSNSSSTSFIVSLKNKKLNPADYPWCSFGFEEAKKRFIEQIEGGFYEELLEDYDRQYSEEFKELKRRENEGQQIVCFGMDRDVYYEEGVPDWVENVIIHEYD